MDGRTDGQMDGWTNEATFTLGKWILTKLFKTMIEFQLLNSVTKHHPQFFFFSNVKKMTSYLGEVSNNVKSNGVIFSHDVK